MKISEEGAKGAEEGRGGGAEERRRCKQRREEQNRPDNRRGEQNRAAPAGPGPSVRVSRAETRLTVYRSAYIRMLCQLVAAFLVERLSVLFRRNLRLLRFSTREVGCE